MKFLLTFTFLISFLTVQSQDVFGSWKTVDDVTGEAKSIIEIYEKDGKAYGKIIEILDPDAPKDAKCIACTGKDKDKPIVGLTFLRGLEKDGDEYNGGTILDPENGKEYKSYIQLASKDKLKVRGYIGFSLLGRTQYWYRVK
ncbi:DUF2147 domain-containing protein [Jejudonia soesokkakensis]|uniref:DUF2147 domain-containing protein n=1 Tax=Jejudonia soesokkakensis TaxID=1323432 RepID=A0ABW2MPU9_9FLAO